MTRYEVTKILTSHGLTSNGTVRRKESFQIIDGYGTCTKCGERKDESYFPIKVRVNYPYRLSYCTQCRTKQSRERTIKSSESYLLDRYQRLSSNCGKTGIPLTITLEEFVTQFNNQGGRCFYTGVPLNLTVDRDLIRTSSSVDKIVPHLGYSQGNTVFCTNRVNTAKGDFTLEEMRIWMPVWYDKIIRFQSRERDFYL